MRTALITGVVGQDGAYLSKHLARLGYRVVGTTPPGVPSPAGFEEAYLDHVDIRRVDLTDQFGMRDLLDQERPDEIYNLAAISSVAASWHTPIPVSQINGLAVLGLLEAIRELRDASGYDPRICQASSAEIFGPPQQLPTAESHPILPNNPYAVAKAFAHFTAGNYRHAYGMFVATVILFNHESPLRPQAFVTRKITSAAVAIAAGQQDTLELGRLDVRRDWGSAWEYTQAMHAALSHDHAGDFCIASGVSHALGEFVEEAFSAAGVADPWRHVVTNPAFVRPNDIPETRGDPRRACSELGWRPTAGLTQIAADLVAVDQMRLTGPEHDPAYLFPRTNGSAAEDGHRPGPVLAQ